MKSKVVSAHLLESLNPEKEEFLDMLAKHNGCCPVCKLKWPAKPPGRRKISISASGPVVDMLKESSQISKYAASVVEWEMGFCPVCGSKRKSKSE